MASAGSDDEQPPPPPQKKLKSDSPRRGNPVADQDQEPQPIDEATREPEENPPPADEETRGPEEPRREESSEKQPPRVPSHVCLPPGYVEVLKGIKNWGDEDKTRWAYDNELKIRRVVEIQQSMDFNDLWSYVVHGDGEEVVWDHDVWNLQAITQVPEDKTVPPPWENSAAPADADSGGKASS